MENVLTSLNAELRMTPKCHPEIAGRGIEYAWGYSKLRFRLHFNNSEARNLERNVRQALSTDVLTKERTDKFVRKARDYKMTYHYLFKTADKVKKAAPNSHEKIEQITKLFKQHRSALDADYSFIRNS